MGFMNKCGQIRGVEAPLLTGLSLGFGNEAEKGPEASTGRTCSPLSSPGQFW